MSRPQIIGAVNALMLVLFTSWALFQYNDPDAPLWVLVYGLGGAGILLFHYRRISPMLLWTYSGLTFLLGAYMALQFFTQPALIMEDTPMLVEEGREMTGAWLISSWTAFLASRASRRARGASAPSVSG